MGPQPQHAMTNPLFGDPVICQLQKQLSDQQEQISHLTSCYNTLAREAQDEARARRSNAAEIILLKAQLNAFERHYNECPGANVVDTFASARPDSLSFAGSVPDSTSELNDSTKFARNASNALNTTWPHSQPSTSHGSTGQLTEISREEREAIRIRMLRDRGPRHTPLPLNDKPVSPLFEAEQASRAPSTEAGAPPLSSPNDGDVPDARHGQAEEGSEEYDDGEETESDYDFAERDTQTDDEDCENRDTNMLGPHVSHAQIDEVHPSKLPEMSVSCFEAVSRPAAGGTASDKSSLSGTDNTIPHNQSAALDGSTSTSAGAPSKKAVDTSEVPFPSGAVNPVALHGAPVTLSEEPAAIYTHQLLHVSPTNAGSVDSPNKSTRACEPDSVDKLRPIEKKSKEMHPDDVQATCDRRDRYQYNTFCTLCFTFRKDSKAVAKCQACPRMYCRDCAGVFGVEFSRNRKAEDAIFPFEKCLCRSRDMEFPGPGEEEDPKAHLVRCLRRHDLSRMFREPVDVEDTPGYLGVIPRDKMIDLGTMGRRLRVCKEYQSSRGQKRFLADLKRIWTNCRDYAGYTANAADEAPGIVRCTIILEAMVQKFQLKYMVEQELFGDHGSEQLESDRRKKERFARCSGGSDEQFGSSSAPFVGTEYGVESQNFHIGVSSGRKRKATESARKAAFTKAGACIKSEI